ncbi:MAG: hypothetical protein QX189_04340 [Methylococcales bacterium]
MIKFKEMRWSNAFSYGKNNKISLDGAALVQLVGKNGKGKSSIGLILEEVLYNQNSKKIKKADILNRYTKDKTYTIEVDFEKDTTKYSIATTRSATSGTVVLIRDGIDVSSHTATGTYKAIEQIIGYDFKTFSQIVYQSSVSALEFLTATDTARKKFLIELLNLSKYTAAADVFKALAVTVGKQVDAVEVKIRTTQGWVTKYDKEDLTLIDIEEELSPPTSILAQVTLLNNELSNIVATNKKITQNNTYIQIFNAIEIDSTVLASDADTLVARKIELAQKQKTLKDGISLAAKHRGPTIKCPTCSQDMDNSTMFNMALEFNNVRHPLEVEISTLEASIKATEALVVKITAHDKKVQEWEKYHALIDQDIPTELLDKNVLASEINVLQASADAINTSIANTKRANKIAADHNSKVVVISGQMVEMKKELKSLSEELSLLVDELSKIQILVKSFSTTGLVAYKIEGLVKDLEELTNKYLTVIADGRFQLSFKIAAADKLNVIITDNGRDIDMLALSSGERARVNVSTLLAIRKLMQTLSNSRTNLLILDETIENLDADGKEKLIEILLEEESLNTFLISHGFSHPLLEKISVIKENNISRIE